MSTQYDDLTETQMPIDPGSTAAAVGMDAATARATAFELIAVTRVLFGVADSTPMHVVEPGPAPAAIPGAPQPTDVDVPDAVGLPVPEALPVHEPPSVADPLPAPAAIPVPTAIPVPDVAAPPALLPEPGDLGAVRAAIPVPALPLPDGTGAVEPAPSPSGSVPHSAPTALRERSHEYHARTGRRSLELLQEIAFLDE